MSSPSYISLAPQPAGVEAVAVFGPMTEIEAALQTYESEFALKPPSVERVPGTRRTAARALLNLATGPEPAHEMLESMANSGLLEVRLHAPSFAVALGKKGALPSAQVVEYLDSQIPELERGKLPADLSKSSHVVAHRAAMASKDHALHVAAERLAAPDYVEEIPSLDAYRAARLGARAMAFLTAETPESNQQTTEKPHLARPVFELKVEHQPELSSPAPWPAGDPRATQRRR